MIQKDSSTGQAFKTTINVVMSKRIMSKIKKQTTNWKKHSTDKKECASQAAQLNRPATAGDAGDVGWIPGLGRSPGVGNGNPLQDSCLENPRDRGAWQATVHGVTKDLAMTKQLNKSNRLKRPYLI